MRRRSVTLLGFVLGAALFGYAMASIPAPDNTATFWVGNFSAPWAVVAFAAGWSQRTTAWAILTAIAAEVACVAGFYGHLLFLDADHLGLPRDTAPLAAALVGLEHWLWFVAFVTPWLVAGIGAGVVYGFLGAWWARSRSLVAGALLAVPFIAEPLVWPVYDGHVKGPALVWIGEVVVGGAVLAVMLLASRRAAGRGSRSEPSGA